MCGYHFTKMYLFLELRCLQTILNDQSKALESDCKSKLEKRMEMFKNAAMVNKFHFQTRNSTQI